MKYVITVEGRKSTLANSKNELNKIVINTEDGLGIICTAWSKDTPGGVMASISEHILGREKSMLVGFQCVIDNTPVDEALWEEFEKALS